MAAPQSGTPRKPRRRWRWHVPPALVHGNETLEGTDMLEEFSGAVGMALWQSARDVTLWAGAREPQERAGLDAAVDAPLRTLLRICRDPEAITEDEVLSACRDISDWAEGQEKLATSITFAQAGALAAPTNAAAGFRVGQLARRKAEYARAESWFRRVIGLGRQAKDWASYSEAFLGLGELYTQRGNLPAARRFHVRGLRAARRHGLRDIQGRALHNLFMLSGDGSPQEALDYARNAFKAYGPSHPRLPVLAHDLAYFWMQRGRFAQALSVFQALVPLMATPEERMRAVADTGRAAAGAGNRVLFDGAWDDVWSSAGDWHARAATAQALLDLARGAANLKDWPRAERAATYARELASRREEAKVVMEADALLDNVTRKRNLDAVQPATNDTKEEAESDVLAADLLRTLGSSRPHK